MGKKRGKNEICEEERKLLNALRTAALVKYGKLSTYVGFDDGVKHPVQDPKSTHKGHTGSFGRIVGTFIRTLSLFLTLSRGEEIEVRTVDLQDGDLYEGIGKVTIPPDPSLARPEPLPRVKYSSLDGEAIEVSLLLPSDEEFHIISIWKK